jgi:hypothetical protein
MVAYYLMIACLLLCRLVSDILQVNWKGEREFDIDPWKVDVKLVCPPPPQCISFFINAQVGYLGWGGIWSLPGFHADWAPHCASRLGAESMQMLMEAAERLPVIPVGLCV